MDYTRIAVEVDGSVGHIRFDVPDEYNRLRPAFWSEFPVALYDELDARGDVRALVISSTGKHFTAGDGHRCVPGPRHEPEGSWPRR